MPEIVGVGDMQVSSDPDSVLVTYALGSCIGVAVYDSIAKVGGLLHAMLPSSTIEKGKTPSPPSKFVDTGVPALFRECYSLGAVKERMTVKVAGGAAIGMGEAGDSFQIGKRNILLLRQLLWKNGLLISGEDVGGTSSRTMSLHLGTGTVTLRIKGEVVTL